ncbi:MAG: hypothetical protein RL741_228 [Actinomycetota bacterium]|jgi:hypothetical protein
MSRKHFAFAVVLSAATLLTSGCAAGFDAATNTQRDSGNGRSVDVGSLQIRSATVVVDPADPTRASVLMTIINNDDTVDDTLIGIATADTVGVEGEVRISLAAKQVVDIGFNSELRIVLTSESGLVPGEFVNVSLILESGQSVPLSMVINEKTGIYADIEIPAVAAQPAPEPIPSST